MLFGSLESERMSVLRVVLRPRAGRKNEPGSCWVESLRVCCGWWTEQLQITFRGEPEHILTSVERSCQGSTP